MNDPTTDAFGSGLVLAEPLPLRWHVCESSCAAPHLQLSNEEILRVILSLDEHHVEANDENPEMALELQRLESKINLVLELVSQVLVRQLQLPDAIPVRLAAHELEWETTTPPAIGSWLQLELFVCTRYPRPLVLSARVKDVAAGRVRAEFDGLGESVQDLLERLIFRHHRRSIAASRRAGS